MKSILAVLILLSINSFAHDHGPMEHLVFANGAVHAHATWTRGPGTPDESILQLEWHDGATHAVAEPPGTFKVVLWMPAHGHGSSPVQIKQLLDSRGRPVAGTYLASKVFFTMGGKWDVRVVFKPTNGTEETQTFQVDLAGGGHQH